jgi:chromate transport protein ChrA
MTVTRSALGAPVRYFLYLATLGFGGPVAPVGFMYRDLVERGRRVDPILGFFTKAGAFVFGSGLAIVPFLHQGVVQQCG